MSVLRLLISTTMKKTATLTMVRGINATTELSMSTTRSGELNDRPSTRTGGLRGFMPETRRLEIFTAGYGRGLEQLAGHDADTRRGLVAEKLQEEPRSPDAEEGGRETEKVTRDSFKSCLIRFGFGL
ncbi:hypothetical protein F2Q68_00031717 [Brassica cretica]|uniref:Uncharacterized protein n=1 Tax=Brassica cretica TaxID=69181 RepID=A0A8S9G5W3_BRACR|nr:hypothetical protein F2Q68_00031717 [Brassica cretica]